MLLRLLTNSLARRGSRKFLAIVAIWIGISLVIALLALNVDVGDKMSLELQSFSSNIKIEPVVASTSATVGGHEIAFKTTSAYLHEDDFAELKAIFWRNNILGISPRLWARGRVRSADVLLLGVWFDHVIPVKEDEPFITGAKQIYPHWQVDGSWPLYKVGSPPQCLIGADLARRLNIAAGDKIEVKTAHGAEAFLVSGIVTGGEREDAAIIAPLETVQVLAGVPGKVSEADVSALTTPENKLSKKYRQDPSSLTPSDYERWSCTSYPGSVAADIQTAIPGSVARVVRRVSETQGVVLTRIEGLMFLLAILTLVVCCLSITGVLASAVLERQGEVALMQAIGAHRADVLLLFLSEASLLGLIGGLLAAATGSLLGRWLVQAIFGSASNIHLALVVFSPFLGLLIAWVGSVWAVWRMVNQDTVMVLYEN